MDEILEVEDTDSEEVGDEILENLDSVLDDEDLLEEEIKTVDK